MSNPFYDGVEKFWGKWIKASELERIELVNTLNFPDITKGVKSASLINSYFVDLFNLLAKAHQEELIKIANKLTALNFPKSLFHILFYLSQKGEANKWEISKETKLVYSCVHKQIKNAKTVDLVKISRIANSVKNYNMKVEYYKLTALGLLVTSKLLEEPKPEAKK